MDLPTSLAYIAAFAKNNSYDTSPEFRDYVESKLGGFTGISEAKAKSLARHLYRAYVIALYTRYDAFHLAKLLSDAQLIELLEAQRSLDKKYKVFYPVVDSEIKKLSKVDAAISEQGEPKYKSILVNLSKVKKSKSVSTKSKPTLKPVAPKTPLKVGDYLGYIAFFIQSQPTTTKHEFRKYLSASLGAVPLEADEDDVRDVARHLYRAYVLGSYTRYRPFHIAESIAAPKDMVKYLDAQIALDKSYGVFEDPGVSSAIAENSHVDGGIKSKSLPGYIAILESMDISKSPTTIKILAAKARAVAKAAKRPAKRTNSAKKKVVAKKKTVVKKSSSPLVVVKKKVPAKKAPVGKAPVGKAKKKSSSPLVVVKKKVTQTDKLMALKSGKEFMAVLAKEKLEKQHGPAKAKPPAVKTVKRTVKAEMTLGELKNIARATGLKGFSTMKKAELKAALKLK